MCVDILSDNDDENPGETHDAGADDRSDLSESEVDIPTQTSHGNSAPATGVGPVMMVCFATKFIHTFLIVS